MGRGRGRVESVSTLLRGMGEKLRRGVLLSDPISLSVPSSAPHPCQKEGTQMEEGLDFHPPLKHLQGINQARAQLECELAQEAQGLARQYHEWQIKLARRHEIWQAQMAKEVDATFQEVFSQASLTDSIKLLPWCISSTFPLCYMSEALATTMQQDEDIPTSTTVPEPEGSLAPGPSNTPAHQTGPLLLPVPPLPDIPFVGTPSNGCPFAGFIASPTQKKWDQSSSNSLGNHHNKRTHVGSQEVEARSENSSAQSDEDTPKLVLEAGPSFKQQGNLPAPLPVQPGPPLILMMVLWQEA